MNSIEYNNDWALLEKIKSSDATAYEHLYSKYAAMMYGCILDICKTENFASRIFKHVFLNLNIAKVSDMGRVPFSFWLWQHTGSETVRFMNKNYQSDEVFDKNKGIIDYLCFNKINREEARAFFKCTNSEIGLLVKENLQSPN